MSKVRYAVVGAGWISQEAFMPAVEQTGNSVMTAIVTGDLEKAKKLADFYGIENVYPYAHYDEMLKAGVADAVYIALPNSMHADYAIRAANAGLHALVEKPLAVSIAESEAMIAAAAKAGVWLMTAYRLHNDPGTLEVLEMVRRGDIGDPRMFQSVLCFQADAGNHRLKAEHWGGPLQDLGVYCINAARHIFASEPIEAVAMAGSDPGDARFTELAATVSAGLRFPGGRLANFHVSFGGELTDIYRIIGSTGEIEVSSAYRFEVGRQVRVSRNGMVSEKAFPNTDDFSGQIAHFSDCILKGVRPEADGEEGLADMRVLLAIEEAARTGRAQKIASPARPGHPVPDMARHFPQAERQLLV
jgi:predicted dehydrogenase